MHLRTDSAVHVVPHLLRRAEDLPSQAPPAHDMPAVEDDDALLHDGGKHHSVRSIFRGVG